MRKRVSGSVAIEAILSISVIMILLITLFGTLLTVYLREEGHWIAMQTKEDMGIYSMPFMGHERIIQEKVNAYLLTETTKMTLNRHIETHSLRKLINIHPDTNVKFGDYGFAELTFVMQFELPALDSVKVIVLPMSACVVSDGNNFSDDLVYITTYGEKYHVETCFHLRKSKYGISLSLAIEKGYEACKNCHSKKPEKN
jgi:hypothetical protein